MCSSHSAKGETCESHLCAADTAPGHAPGAFKTALKKSGVGCSTSGRLPRMPSPIRYVSTTVRVTNNKSDFIKLRISSPISQQAPSPHSLCCLSGFGGKHCRWIRASLSWFQLLPLGKQRQNSQGLCAEVSKHRARISLHFFGDILPSFRQAHAFLPSEPHQLFAGLQCCRGSGASNTPSSRNTPQTPPYTHGVVMGGEVKGVLVCQQLVVGIVLVALLAVGTVIVIIQDLGEKQEDRGHWKDPLKAEGCPPFGGNTPAFGAARVGHRAYRSCSLGAEPAWPLPAVPLLENTALPQQLLLETKRNGKERLKAALFTKSSCFSRQC